MLKIDLIELFDSYCVLRELEDNSLDYFGNVDYVFNVLLDKESDTFKFFEHCYENYVKGDK